MKTVTTLALLLGLSVASIACSKADKGSSATSTAGTVSSGAGAASAAAPSTAAATAAPAAKAAFVQKGLKPGKVVVGYLQDNADPNQCAVVADDPANKEKFTKDGDKLAAMMKSKVVSTCPTDNVVGTCNAGFGVLVNYSGPKWTAETAKKDCASHKGATWVE
jgi:hypothetical protein